MGIVGVGIGPGQILTQPVRGYAGDWSSIALANREQVASWVGGVLVDIWTTTVGGATSGHDYVLTVTANGSVVTTVTYESDASATIDEIVTGLTAAWNADPIASAYGIAVGDTGANTITVTGIGGTSAPPLAFTVSDSDSDLTTVHTQAASDGTGIGFARFAIKDVTKLTNPTPQGLPVSSLTAKAASGTITYASGAFYNWQIAHGGVVYSDTVPADTDTATTLTAFLASINGKMPANTVLASSGGAGAFTLTAEVAGAPYAFTYSVTGAAESNLTFTNTDVATDDISRVGLGFSLRRSDVAGTDLSDESNTVLYPPGSAIPFAQYGRQWLDADGTPTSGAAVYVDTTTGKAGASSGSGKCLLPGAKWSGRSTVDLAAYEVVLSLPQTA